MENISYPVVDFNGNAVGNLELPASIFAAPELAGTVYDTVRWQLMKRRQGTHSVLSKGEMKGGGKKPWKQKGTGRARAGSNTSPLWVGGAVAHGPKPHDYIMRTNKTTRAQALKSALTDSVKEKKLVIVESLPSTITKTKQFASGLKALGINGKKVLFVQTKGASDTACRNINKLKSIVSMGVNVYDILNNDILLCTKEGINEVTNRLLASKS